jgi:hypothetical protein
MTAYTAVYATGDVQSAIIDMLVAIVAGINLQALAVGGALALFIVLTLYTKILQKVLHTVASLVGWGKNIGGK